MFENFWLLWFDFAEKFFVFGFGKKKPSEN